MSERIDVPQPPAESSIPTPRHRKWRRRFKFFGVASLLFIVVMAALTVSAEYYTSRPQFCGSCHIMDPYYHSWQKDTHSDPEKVNAACVDCHYAPGEHHTLMAKFRGLSQAASYFSGRSGAGRPKARVNDGSCMTSGCHGDQKFMNTELRMGNVTFVHAKHLDPNGKIAITKGKELVDLRAKLTSSLGPNRVATIELLAKPIGAAEERNHRLADWLAEQKLSGQRDDVLAYGELLHTEVRLKHLEGFKCSSCHQFNANLQSHFSVAKTTCYTCHFINESFNANSGRCLSCHEPPTSNVPIHAAEGPGMHQPAATTAGAVTMNHATIVANNVNCVSCHADLIHGSGQVSRRDCQNCHDQDRYLKDFDRLTTNVVEEYHRVHAAGQRARCNDCHQVIDHHLTPVAAASDAIALLAPVRKDCQHCHPDHHREQIEMLLGQGGFVENATGAANPMTGSRANCQACHTKEGEDPKQEAVITGTLESCRGCHGQEYMQLFTRWKESIASRLKEAQDLMTKVETRMSTSAPGELHLAEATRLRDRAKRNINLVSTANGIHNKNYAFMLLDQAVGDLESALKQLPR